VLDTGYLFQKIRSNRNDHYSLDHLANTFNIPLHDRHTASGDAFITALVFLKTISKLDVNHNLKLKHLERPAQRVGLL
ncbi:MAG: 3'-5' exonuclease, partial [Bacteroidota bacterium]